MRFIKQKTKPLRTREAPSPLTLTLSILRTAKALGICRATVYGLIRNKKFRAFRAGRSWRVSVQSIQNFLGDRPLNAQERRNELINEKT
jgi:excisionase family DNA binding protein